MIRQPSPPKAPVGTGGSDQCRPAAGLCLVLAAITFAVFGQTLAHEFIDVDDGDYVYENPMVAQGLTPKGIVWAFTQTHAANWHPLTWLSHMLDCQFYGLNPGGHHLTNVLLHTATVIALFLVLRQMTGGLWRSAFVAVVFAIHPLRAESVAWVAERKDVLSGLFFMLTIGAYVRYARRPWSAARYGLVLLLFALGLMSKPMLVTLPVVLLLLDYWPLQRVEPSKLLGLVMEKLPLLALSAAVAGTTLLAQHKFMFSTETVPLPSRFANALVTCMIYLGQMVWPAGLAAFYPYPRNGLPSWELMLAGTLLGGLSAVAVWQRRKQPWMLMGWLWYLVMLLPVVGVIQVGAQAHADRYTYLPQIGIYVAVTWLVAEWSAKLPMGRIAIGSLMTAILAVLMICAWKQTAYWKNSETLWSHTLNCTTGNYIAQNNLGLAFRLKGKLDEAIPRFQNALQIRPDFAEAHVNLGIALRLKGKLDEAITHYQNALQIWPDFAEAHYNLGLALDETGRVDEAISHYQQAVQIKPDLAEAHNNLGNALLQKGRVDEAIAHFQNALQIKPLYAEARYNLGVALAQKGRVEEAITEYQYALQINPLYAKAHYNLGNALLQKGRLDEAIAHFQKALQIKSDYAEACNNLGNTFLQRGRVNEAIAHFQKALQIKPDYADAHLNLGSALLQKGGLDEAIAHFKNALQIRPDYANARYDLGVALAQQGRGDEAIDQFQKALQIKPDYAEAHINLGVALLQKEKVGEAIAQFNQALQIEPANPGVQNNLAWVLATCPQASLRNGDKAVELARQANALTGGENPIVLHTLAAALAEAGRFSEAVETVQRALHLAEAQSNAGLAGQLQAQLKLYQAGRPFHNPAQTH